MNKKNLEKLITEALAIEAMDAKENGVLGYIARALVQATLPHSRIETNEFERRNGSFRLTILANSTVGLPYGSIPRLLLAWITTEAVQTRKRELVLGDTLSEFMKELGLIPTGGRWGTITRLRQQMQKLFSAAVSCTYDDGQCWAIRNVQPVIKASLWWDPKMPNQMNIFESTITLGEEFFNETIANPIPINMMALKALKRSPLALDIYCWLTYRMSYLKKPTEIPWPVLQLQFGANYSMTSEQGVRDFKRAFLRELKKVNVVYNDFNAENSMVGLLLKPGKPHIQALNKPVN